MTGNIAMRNEKDVGNMNNDKHIRWWMCKRTVMEAATYAAYMMGDTEG